MKITDIVKSGKADLEKLQMLIDENEKLKKTFAYTYDETKIRRNKYDEFNNDHIKIFTKEDITKKMNLNDEILKNLSEERIKFREKFNFIFVTLKRSFLYKKFLKKKILKNIREIINMFKDSDFKIDNYIFTTNSDLINE